MSGGGSGGVPPEVEVSQESLDQVWQSIRENLLTPKGNHHPPAGRAPRVAFVAGQPASGKSSIEDYVKRDLELDNPVQIDADALRELHPAYDEWAKKDTLTAAARTQEVVGDWVDKAIAYVTGPNQRFDAVVSATLKNPDKARAKIKPFHDRHYDVFVAFTAVDRINSSLAIVKRYLKGNRPGRWARYVPLDVHELACEGVLQTARQIDQKEFGDINVRVYRKIGPGPQMELVYKNSLDGDSWLEEGGRALTEETIVRERRSYWDRNIDGFRAVAGPLLVRDPLHDTVRRHVAQTMCDFLDEPSVCLINLPHLVDRAPSVGPGVLSVVQTTK
ncbi:zeta toxin family protein [Streptomyces sp. NPDC102405]|uniref:zeta toxin family protein n=1 Tax=Streptomyces sp. NPDC102405 TaxID=3366170 RepID=UPI00382E0E8A